MLSKIKSRFQELDYLESRVVVPMGLACLILLLTSAFLTGWLESVLIELSITCLGVIITVAYVDRMNRRRDEQRWSGAKKVADLRVTGTSYQLIEAVASHVWDTETGRPFHLPFNEVRMDPQSYFLQQTENDEWRRYIRSEVIPNSAAIINDLDQEE